MKKIFIYLLTLCVMVINAQEDVFGNNPVPGIIPIKRNVDIDTETKNKVVARTVTNASPATPTGNSTEVGVTEGQLSVSLTGGATYNIPIALPPGINGIVPQVSLSYNSQGGNGLAGYGWNVSGISAITRIPATKHHDNTIDAVDYDGLDRFAFDGQRLIVKNGTNGVYGADGTEYETENYSNIQITSYGVHPNGVNYGPSYFKVEYPDGSVAIYGASRARTLTEWPIVTWNNPQRVVIYYTYNTENNNLSINKILYGERIASNSIMPQYGLNEISFIYKNRVRPEQAYVGGQSFLRSNILSEIKVTGNYIGYRNYYLQHETTSLGYERLKSITEKSGDNSKSFNPTVFNYDNTSENISFLPGVSTLSVNNIRSDNAATVQGDFNGDGNMDIILYPTNGNGAKSKYWLFTDINGNSLNIGSEHNIGTFVNIFPTSWLNHLDKLMPMQGWCAIQHNATTNETSFKNYSAGITYPIYHQYDKVHQFPKLAYYVDCINMPNCDLNIGVLEPRLEQRRPPVDFIGIDEPFDPIDPDLSNCALPSNISLSEIINGEATLFWTSTSSLSVPIMWEVYYFETGQGNAPNNYDPISTYTVVNQQSINLSNLNPLSSYTFYVRSICTAPYGNVASNWVGPIVHTGMIDYPQGETRYQEIPKEYISGDFNGDGLTDVLAIEKSTSYTTRICQGNCYINSYVNVPGGNTHFVNLDRRLTTNYVNQAGYMSITNSSKFIVADFNGDGKSDVYVFDNGVCKVYGLNNSNYLELLTTIYSGNINLDKPVLMGDYNGDGKADFIIPKEINSRLFTKYFSTGTNLTADEVDLGIGPFVQGIKDKYGTRVWYIIPNDFNNDGKTDLVHAYVSFMENGNVNDINNYRYISLRYFSNKGSTFESSMLAYKQTVNDLTHYPIPVSLSFDKAHANKQISFLTKNFIHSVVSPKDNVIDNRLKEIVSGNGVKEAITYQSLNEDNDSVFEPSTYTEVYPNLDIKVADNFQVVFKIEQVTPSQYKEQKFKYYGAVSNVSGIGFLGFRGLARTNWFNQDHPIISSVSKHDIAKRGAVVETYAALGETYGNFTLNTPSNFINKTTISYTDQLLNNKVYKIKNDFTITINGLDGTSKEVSTVFNNLNNPESTTTITKNGTVIEQVEDVAIEYYPVTTLPTYVSGRLKKKNASVTHNGDTMTGEEIYTYNTNHLVSKIEKKGHNTNYLTEENLYDTFGNIIEKKITATGLFPRITTFGYDPSGRFLTSSKDIEGLTTTYTYNTSNGLMLTETLPSNVGYPLITTYQYDVWGKKTKVTDYLGKNLNYNYSWINPGTHGYYAIGTLGDDNSSTVSWFDDLGRKITEGNSAINDNYIRSWKSFEYDIYNRVLKSYAPKLFFLPDWSGLFSTTTYDAYGRTTEIIEETGKTTNISYNGLTTTATDGTKTTTSIKNALGNVISMTDNGGTITYQHFANGNLKHSNFNGVIVAIEQDGWGRKKKLIDPSAGTYEYQYNEFGEIIKEITPKGETTFKLDNYGKTHHKTIIGTGGDPTNTKTTYTYDPTTKLLTNTRYDDFTGGFYTLYSFGYDNYKRLNFNDESGFNAYYQRAVQFDGFGRPEKELYTAVSTPTGNLPTKQSSKWVKNTYKNGQHWQIIDDATNQILWEAKSVNARGQLTNANYGNGISISNTYDQYGFATQFKHDKSTAPQVNVMTLNTSFDAQRGNLLNRYSSLFDYREDFTYDSLDRLTNWKETGELLCECNFNANLQGFQVVNGASVSLNSSNRLLVSGVVSTNGRGTQKLVKSDVAIGKKINIKGNLQIHTATAGTTVHISFYSRDPITGNTQGYNTVGMIIGNGNFNFGTTITSSTLKDVYVMFLMRNPSNPSAFMAMSIDDLKITMEEESMQTYDTLGRINTNNVGTYNYTNVNTANSIPKHFQNSSINTNIDYTNYYSNRQNLDVTYNTFKSPINIEEVGKDKLSFIYNMNNSRSTMYYGGLQNDKYLRPKRNHYSTDGSMEIRQNIATGTIEFITYIGGDAYTAPIVLKSDGTTQNYFYLHRDYLGSIVAISNATGTVVEKRHFDAWGNIKRIQDGTSNNLLKLTFFDRGYTGHEHLQDINIIHMNGRLYDPVVHRFLQPDNFIQDPSNTQNYNRYSYVLNNPLKYWDPTGENWFERNWKAIVVTVAVVVTVVVVVASLGTATPLVTAMWAGAAGGFVGGSLGTALNGGNFLESITAGVMGGLKGAIFGVAGAYMSAAIGAVGIIPGMLSSASTSTVLGALGNIVSGEEWDKNIGINAGLGLLGGGASGYQAAKSSGSGIWMGTKPATSALSPTVNNSTENINKSIEEAKVTYEKSLSSQAKPTNETLFRGGNKMELSKADLSSGIDKATGLMKIDKGLSLNSDKFNKFIDQKGGAFEVDLKTIPNELRIINSPIGSTHYMITPVQPISPSVFQNLLNQVRVNPFNVIK